MTIMDFNAKVEEFARWDAARAGYTNPRNFKFGHRNLNTEAIPASSTTINTDPILAKSSIQDLFNNTSVSQTQTVTFSETTTEMQSSTTTHGAKFSTTVTTSSKFAADLKFKILGTSTEQSVSVAVTAEYNYSSSQTKSITNSRTWTVSQPVVVPPHSRVTCNLLIYDAKFSIPMYLKSDVEGTIPWSNNGYVGATCDVTGMDGKKYIMGIALGRMLTSSWPGKPPEFVGAYTTPGSSVVQNGLKFQGTGLQSVVNGLYSMVKFTEQPLTGHSGETRTYYSAPQLVNEDNIISTGYTNIPIINPITGSLNDFIV